MSQENQEIVRQVVQAFNRRDLPAMTQRFDPEIEWEPVGPAAVERSIYRGLDAVSSGFAAAWEAWEVFQVEESQLRELEDSVVWLGRAQLRGGTSHVELDQEFAILFVMAGDKVVRIRGFLGWHEALEAAGLSE